MLNNSSKPMVGGTVKGEPDFTPSLNATFVGTGKDYIQGDTDQQKLRLDARSVLKTDDGAGSLSLLPFEY
jgi:hypothetical protein